MGVSAVDKYTAAHLLWGCASRLAIPSALTGPFWDFTVAMGLHVISEWNENDTDPQGNTLESVSNHVIDQIAYTTGWVMADALGSSVIISDNQPHSATSVFLFASATQFFWTTLFRELAKEINMRIEWG